MAPASRVSSPTPNRRTLGAVEDAVLNDLDPSLNLKGVSVTPSRDRLRALRCRRSCESLRMVRRLE